MARSAPGDVDLTFGNGPVITAFGNAAAAQAVLVQGDGKIVVAGYGNEGGRHGFAVARYLADGNLDPAFNGNGRVTTLIGSGSALGMAAALQNDGKIVVAGYADTAVGRAVALARYETGGSLDPTFNSTGIVTTQIGASYDQAWALAIRNDGAIVVAGMSHNGTNYDFAILRYLPDGTLDPAFNGTGIVTTPLGSNDDIAQGVALQDDGKIVAVGYTRDATTLDYAFGVTRYETSGALDTTFGGTGKVITTFGSTYGLGASVAVQEDGRIVVAGMAVSFGDGDFAIARYDTGGNLDPTFNGTGQVLTDFWGASHDWGESIAVQTDGKIVVAGYVGSYPNYDFAVARYLSDGSPDTAFGGSGHVTLGIGSRVDYGYAVALQGDGKIVVAGEAEVSGSTRFGVVRLIGDDTATEAPTLTAPAAGTVSGDPVSVDFTLPEAALAGTVTLSFGAHPLVLASSQETVGPHSFSFDPADPTASAEIASGAAIPDGAYTVMLSYQDTLANPAASASSSDVTIDTVAPTIGGTFTPLIVADGTNLADYTPQATVIDATNVTLVQEPAPGTSVSVGTTTVTLTGTDEAGNVGTHDFDVLVRPLDPVTMLLLAKGNPAPGIGTPLGPPADALLTSFGVPAIDDLGNIAFTAKWIGATDGKGAGVFTATRLVASVGGPVPGTDATFKTLGDPVIDSDYVSFLATLGDVPKAKAAAVLSEGPLGGLSVIAQVGDAAPGAGGATFRSFKAVAVKGRSIAVFAQLKAPAASDLGVWVQDATHPLTLVLREGQTVGTRTIKTLVTFAAGNGSPGAGRGWLLAPGGTPHVLALAHFTDKTQAVIDARIDGNVSVYSQSGPGGAGGPTIAGASFASYGVPVANGGDDVAFLGTLTVGAGDVTKANARGVFANIGSTLFTPILRVGDVVSSSGAFVSVLKDPVFACDGTLAFPATLKGGDFKGLTTRTLFWKRQTGGLDLLAQGGAGNRPVPGLPDAQFKSFPSLAVASGRGPLFTATLVPGKGGVTKTNASGVWAMDFNHTLRLLFRTGDMIGGKTVKSFTLLKAVRGSAGVTRSFNEAGQVAWLATFTDKTTAIVVSEVP